MKNTAALLEDLTRRRPEWRPWLALVEATRLEIESGRWDGAVQPESPAPRSGAPLLDGTTVHLERKTARRFFQELLRTAIGDGTPKMMSLRPMLDVDADDATLFAASVRQDAGCVGALAADVGTDPEALQAVVSLLALPFQHAFGRRWRSLAREEWSEGFCPTCGSWPAFAEVRGIERTRYLRCGRCGGQWQAPPLRCPYCLTSDHERLATLVPASGPHTIEVCCECLGYVKAFTRLQGCESGAVMLEDLASVDLDVAAVSLGYRRAEGSGYTVEIAIADARRRLFAWNA